MSEDQLLFVLLFMCAIGFGALNRNLSRNRRNKGNTTVTPNPGKNEVCTEIGKKYGPERRAMVAALVVGQDVYVVSNDGRDFKQGKVTKVTPEGVEVLTASYILGIETLSQRYYDVDLLGRVEPMRFDNEGNNGSDGHEGMNVWGFDWYPWRIDDVPFAERRSSAYEFGAWYKDCGSSVEVTFDQLPEQIRKHYPEIRRAIGKIRLQETQAVLMFWPGPDERGLGWVDVWKKTKDDWVLTTSGMAY